MSVQIIELNGVPALAVLPIDEWETLLEKETAPDQQTLSKDQSAVRNPATRWFGGWVSPRLYPSYAFIKVFPARNRGRTTVSRDPRAICSRGSVGAWLVHHSGQIDFPSRRRHSRSAGRRSGSPFQSWLSRCGKPRPSPKAQRNVTSASNKPGTDHGFRNFPSAVIRSPSAPAPGTPDSSGTWGRATLVARARPLRTEVRLPQVPAEVGVPKPRPRVLRPVGGPRGLEDDQGIDAHSSESGQPVRRKAATVSISIRPASAKEGCRSDVSMISEKPMQREE